MCPCNITGVENLQRFGEHTGPSLDPGESHLLLQPPPHFFVFLLFSGHIKKLDRSGGAMGPLKYGEIVLHTPERAQGDFKNHFFWEEGLQPRGALGASGSLWVAFSPKVACCPALSYLLPSYFLAS